MDNNKQSGWGAYKRLLSYVRQFWPALLLSITGFVLYALGQSAFAGLMQFLPAAFDATPEKAISYPLLDDYISLQTAADYRIFFPLAVGVIMLTRGVGSYLGGYYIVYVARNVVNRLRQDLFKHMLSLPGSFYNATRSGDLLSTITFNVEQVTGAATDALKVLVREGLTVVALLSYVFYLNWKLSMVFIFMSPFILVIVGVASRLFRKYSRRIQDSMGGVTHVSSEAIKGFQVVKAFGGRDYETSRFGKSSEYNLRQSLKLARVDEISTPIIQLLTFMAIALLFWFGLSPSIKGEMDTGTFLAYITAASLLAKPLRQLTQVNSKIQRGVAAAQSIFEIMETAAEIDQGSAEMINPRGLIEFRNLNFRYPGVEESTLSDINLRINPGETVALVGRSGAGKSTLANLLPRFVDAPLQQIFVDGVALEDYRLADLRKNIAVVNQHIVLFQDSVAGNIAYGDLADASAEAIEKAATTAHATEFINTLAEGMQTQIGEDGVNLSGGQRQRLALARAILKDAPILILDEATSALDTESERYIQDALETVMQGRTTLVIAHRLSTIEKADKIVVMDKGQIVETGTHTELLAKGGAYSQLYQLQFGGAHSSD